MVNLTILSYTLVVAEKATVTDILDMIVGLEKYAYDDFCDSRDGTNSASRNDEDENKEFKSKNLEAERRRRQKLSDRLLELRSLVPNISNAMIQEPFNPFTWFLLLIYCVLKHIFICILPCKLTKSFPNSDIVSILQMNKATIITDAIAYIEELQSTVRDLSDQLYQMDVTLKEATENQNKQIVDAAEEMKKWGIEVPPLSFHL